ncbi:hypothetical protein Q5705_13575 [Kosakonia sp. H02]|nr:hypothetical protein Q5705_13575 [Kosakonia sp. H02]
MINLTPSLLVINSSDFSTRICAGIKVSTREEILDPSKYWSESGIKGGLLYSEVLGWLDMGHARGDDIQQLMARFAAGEASGKNYYEVEYQRLMTPKPKQ